VSDSERLRTTRAGTIINLTSKQQEKAVLRALVRVHERLQEEFGYEFNHKKSWTLREIVSDLSRQFPTVDFNMPLAKSNMKPDGGILSLVGGDNKLHPVLITEKKNQGTNDRRKTEGKKKQAMGNAIERLGKNVIGLKTAMIGAGIFPFVCFGDGCDFADASSILDRVVTMAMFGHLRKIYVTPLGPNEEFLRGSFYFREEHWTEDEMFELMYEISGRSVHHYIARFGKDYFAKA
jgi:type II restriction enzyme